MTKTMTTVARFALALLTVSVACRGEEVPGTDAAAQPVSDKAGTLGLKLSFEPGSEIAPWTARLTNHGEESLTLVQPGDGSSEGWRPPCVTWIVETREGEPVSPPGLGRCGNLNGLTPQDFVELAPGETHPFTAWIHPPRVASSGRYRVALDWAFDPMGNWGGATAGAEHERGLARLRTLPAFHVRSEFVELELTGLQAPQPEDPPTGGELDESDER